MFCENQILNQTYQILKPLGNGGTSSVYLGYHLRLRKHVVIKQLKGRFSSDFLMRTEVDILKNLHHPHLPQVYDFIQDGANVYTIIDFVDGYDLEAYIAAGSKFPEAYIKKYLRQTAQVLDYLHSQRQSVIHSDIKPGNIIVNQEGDAILIDFNTSIGGNQGNLLGLTMPYASPEQIQLAQYAVAGQTAPFELDGRSDIYSLGATFYELISGIRPTPGVQPALLSTMGLTEYSPDLLKFIDRMMTHDRDRRLSSAKKLLSVLDRLDSGYWTYFALRCVSLVLSAALIGGGLFCLIRGSRRASMEQYNEQYNNAVSLVEQGHLDQAEDVFDSILASADMQAYLQDEPMEIARMYHAMGDLYYYRQDYSNAALYYRYAIQKADEADQEEYVIFLRDGAVACAQCGDLEAARSMLATAQDCQIAAAEDLHLMSVVIEAYSGNLQQCIASANQLIAASRDQEVCLRAALAVAAAAEDIDTRIHWLGIARTYDTGKNALRGLAVACGEKAQTAADVQDRNAAMQQALSLYEQLCDSVYASSNDILNYSVILRLNGRSNQATDVLKTALEYDKHNYRILSNLCFIYYEQGNRDVAFDYCQQAVQAWQADTSPDKLAESDEEIQDLLELARRFGIGGI